MNTNLKTFGAWVEHIVAEGYTINIPDYQRLYSWDKSNAQILLDDLIKNKEYFLGLFLVEEDAKNKQYNIIDGQQRFTTLFMLFSVLSKKYPESLFFNNTVAIQDFLDYEGVPRLSLQEGGDREFFKKKVKHYHDEKAILPSHQNIDAVLELYEEKLNDISNSESIIRTISSSKILIHSADNAGTAMQIFELLNDRGKPLTQLEALKSFVMHQVYIKSKDDTKVKENHLETIKNYFSDIYKNLNEIHRWKNLDEDDILRYHFIAFEVWKDQNDRKDIKNGLKSIFYNLDLEGLKQKTEEIKNSFELVKQIISQAHSNCGKKWLKNVYILDRMATFYPLLMAIQKKDPLILDNVCNYLELFTYRAFGIMNKRTDTALSKFYSLARDLPQKNNVLEEVRLIVASEVGESLNNKFESGLVDPHFYTEQSGIDGRYILLKYENFLQTEKKNQKTDKKGHEINYIDDMSEILNFESRTKSSLSIEHIIAQALVEDKKYIRKITEGFNENKIKDPTNVWKKTEFRNYKDTFFQENYLHCLGNLVISRGSSNSEKGKNKPEDKDWSTFESQLEINEMIEKNKRKRSWRKDFPFTVDEIQKRQDKMMDFAKSYWSHVYLLEENEEGFKEIQERESLI